MSTERRKSRRRRSSATSSSSSSLVYIPDDTYAWLPAKISSMNEEKGEAQVQVLPLSPDDTVVVLTNSSSSSAAPDDDEAVTVTKTVKLPLPAQNKTSCVGDMADLRHLHEAAILYNLKERHYQSKPYTRVGDIVVAMNPFEWLPDLYTPECRNFYANLLVFSSSTNTNNNSSAVEGEQQQQQQQENTNNNDNSSETPQPNNNNASSFYTSEYDKLGHDPHVYESSCLAFKGMWHDQQHQTILVTGESGAGKTETVKIVMTHLATMGTAAQGSPDETILSNKQQNQNNNTTNSVMMQRVLQSNPILEAFGNAQTLRNENSSRFGKLTELQFDWSSSSSGAPPLAGSICTTYLLEKSRVVGQSLGERNYHVFYQLLSAPGLSLEDDFKEWVWKDYLDTATADDFACLNADNNNKNIADKDDWPQTLEALHVFGFTGDTLRTLLRALCCVLQLSNIQFAEEVLEDNPELEGPTVISSAPEELEKLEDVIGIDPLFLQEAMTKRSMSVGTNSHHDTVKVQLSPSVAKESCNALAKEIYARIFQVLVSSINEKTQGEVVQNNKEQHHRHRRRRRRRKSELLGESSGVAKKKKSKKKRRDSMESSFSTKSSTSSREHHRKSKRRGSNASQDSNLTDTSSSYNNTTTTHNNSSGGGNRTNFGIICLLDIFGFERFDVNRFEQLCINYANEHLQNKYVLDNFGRIQEEYEAEGIDLFDFRLIDNSPVLTVLEHKLSGVLTALHEECIRPKGNDESFVYKIKVVHSKSSTPKILVSEKLHRKTEFGIQHFAGLVTYNSTDFVERNTDQLPTDLIRCVAQHSTNELIRSEFQQIVGKTTTTATSNHNNKKKNNKKTTVLQTFRVQLQDLMNRLSPTHTRYIRCIKPNQDMIPKKTHHLSTMRQLECAGLVTAITISRETYPNKLEYGTCQYRFECLLLCRRRRRRRRNTNANQTETVKVNSIVSQTYQALCSKSNATADVVDPNSDEYKAARKETVRFLLTNLIPPDIIVRRQSMTAGAVHKQQQHSKNKKEPFACGTTKVYFRAGVLEYLENERLEYYTERVIQIQSWFRCFVTNEWYRHLSVVVVRLQSYARRQLTRLAVKQWKRMAYRIYGAIRVYQARQLAQQYRETRAARLIQSRWRCFRCQEAYSTIPTAVRVLQRSYRNYRGAQREKVQRKQSLEKARMDEKLLVLHNQVNTSIRRIQQSSSTGSDYAATTNSIRSVTSGGGDTADQLSQRSHDAAATATSPDGSSPSKQPKSSTARRVVNEDLLQDVESMFEYLRTEMDALRTTNAQLQEDIQHRDAGIQEWKGRTQAAEAAAVAHSLTVTKLTKQKAGEDRSSEELQRKVHELKQQLRTKEQERGEGILRLRDDAQRVIDEKDDQMDSLRNRYTKAVKMHQKDLAILQSQHNRTEEELLQENMRFKEELKRTQESHHEYLAKLMDVLETTHQTREEETAKISHELRTVKEEKNSTIATLQAEIAGLKQTILINHSNSNADGSSSAARSYANYQSPAPLSSPSKQSDDENETAPRVVVDADKNQISQVSALKTSMERSKEARAQRGQQFQEIAARLHKHVGSADTLIHLVTSCRKQKVEEETCRCAKMVSFLEELYTLENESQHELNDDVLEMMDSYLLHCQPNVAMKQLQDGYQKIHEENVLLKQQALTQGHCPRCEARDKRRIATKTATLQQSSTATSQRAASPVRGSSSNREQNNPSGDRRSSTPSRAVTMRRRRSLSLSRKNSREVTTSERAAAKTPPPPKRTGSYNKRDDHQYQPPLLPPSSSTTTSGRGNKTPPRSSTAEKVKVKQQKQRQQQQETTTTTGKDKAPKRDSLGKSLAKTMGFGGSSSSERGNNSTSKTTTTKSNSHRTAVVSPPGSSANDSNSSSRYVRRNSTSNRSVKPAEELLLAASSSNASSSGGRSSRLRGRKPKR